MTTASPYSNVSNDVKVALNELENGDETLVVPRREAEELFRLDKCVQIFFITADGKVSTFSAPSSLRIFRFKQQEDNEEWTPTFIQVGGWTHPLIPGASPVLEAANGAVMFPDVYADSSDAQAAVGLIFPEDLPEEVRRDLMRILQENTALKSEEQVGEQLGAAGRALVTTAGYVVKGVELGTKKACQLIEYVGDKQKEKYPAAQEDAKMSAAAKYSAKGAKYATHATVKVSGFVANRVGKLSKKTASYLANQLVTPKSKDGPKSSSSMQSLVDAAKGGLVAAGTVYTGLEESAKVLGTCVKDKSVTVVEHRYGQEAGEVYGDSMSAAGNAAMTYMNVSSLGIKGLVKKTAKRTAMETGKNIIIKQ